jgi:hypothetical protein
MNKHHGLGTILVITLAIDFSGKAQAAPAKDPLMDSIGICSTMTDDLARLACFDRLAASRSEATRADSDCIEVQSAPSVASNTNTVDAFGLEAAEETRRSYSLKSIDARVTSLQPALRGQTAVELDNGQLWLLLDGPDPLLGDKSVVRIKRAAFGSFLMITNTGQTHRVHRIR